MPYEGYKNLLVQKEGKILVIKFNNPRKKNCINYNGYKELTRVLGAVNEDEGVTIVVFTGVGDFFTAGNDLSQSSEISDMDAYFKESNATFKAMVDSFINCTKLIFSLVNGPAIGIGSTIVGLSDVAWCAEEVWQQVVVSNHNLTCCCFFSGLFPDALQQTWSGARGLLQLYVPPDHGSIKGY